MLTIPLQPVCSPEQANQPAREGGFCGLFLRPQHYDVRVTESAVGLLAGERKFVYLKNILDPAGVALAARTLPRLRFGRGRRLDETYDTYGEDMVMGYYLSPTPTKPTRRYPRTYFTVAVALCRTFQQLLTAHWPEALASALAQDRARIGAELNIFSDVPPAPIFSTLTLNHNVIFPAHTDSRNSEGPSALAVFGRWVGGELCFPRLRVAFPLEPGDVLLADTRGEQHGNVGPLIGTRISAVAYRVPIA